MSCIVFLKDIKIGDYRDIEDEFNDRLLQGISTNDIYKVDTSIKYDIILPIFKSIETWPKVTNIRCWTCDFTFTSIPIFIPISIRRGDDEWNISVLGNFCTFNCACRHIIDYLNPDLLDSLIKLYYLFYNVKINKIEPTPQRQIMEKYGGYMSEEVFLSLIKKLSLRNEEGTNLNKQYVQDHDFESNLSSENEDL